MKSKKLIETLIKAVNSDNKSIIDELKNFQLYLKNKKDIPPEFIYLTQNMNEILEIKYRENLNDINLNVIMDEISGVLKLIKDGKYEKAKSSISELIRDINLLKKRNMHEKEFLLKIKYDNIYNMIEKFLLKLTDIKECL